MTAIDHLHANPSTYVSVARERMEETRMGQRMYEFAFVFRG